MPDTQNTDVGGSKPPMRLEETLSSKHSGEGERFTVTLIVDI